MFTVSYPELLGLNDLQSHLDPALEMHREDLPVAFLSDPELELPEDATAVLEGAPSNASFSMPPPPTLRQRIEEDSEPVDLPYTIYELDAFTMALALWVKEAGISRKKYFCIIGSS